MVPMLKVTIQPYAPKVYVHFVSLLDFVDEVNFMLSLMRPHVSKSFTREVPLMVPMQIEK